MTATTNSARGTEEALPAAVAPGRRNSPWHRAAAERSMKAPLPARKAAVLHLHRQHWQVHHWVDAPAASTAERAMTAARTLCLARLLCVWWRWSTANG